VPPTHVSHTLALCPSDNRSTMLTLSSMQDGVSGPAARHRRRRPASVVFLTIAVRRPWPTDLLGGQKLTQILKCLVTSKRIVRREPPASGAIANAPPRRPA
jgi:hypothetical protein